MQSSESGLEEDLYSGSKQTKATDFFTGAGHMVSKGLFQLLQGLNGASEGPAGHD
jgi:hypothetical protein